MFSAGTSEHSTRRPLPVPTRIGRAYQLPIAFFQRNVLPPLHPDLDLDGLIDKGIFRNAVTKQGKLWGYGEKTPSMIRRKNVKHAFAHLQRGVGVVMKAVESIKPKPVFNNIVFNNNSEGVANFAQRTDDSLPDAFFVLRSAKSNVVKWANIAVLGEYKKENTEENVEENMDKICQSMTNCMREDPRRRFLYGFTAEDASMKMWYCDRSQVVVSDPFDFIQNYHVLFHFILALMSAELHELGWDPTMTIIDGDGPVQYDITVCPADTQTAVYRTLEVLSDSSARHVLGRGTRVWKAVKVVDGEQVGEPVALKDAWVDSSREREGDITNRIRQSQLQADDSQSAEEFFLTIECHGDVFVNGIQDRTRPLLAPVSSTQQRVPSETSKGTTHRSSSKSRASRFQAHYRIVFKEVGVPLSQVTSMHAIFKRLMDVLAGVLAVHKSGWVHRDLSTGNILVVNNTGKITDFEYATKLDEQRESSRTGTPHFVAVEVDCHAYLFRPPPKFIEFPDDSDSVWLERAEGTRIESPAPQYFDEQDIRHYPFRFNPLHDLESLWWIAVYFIVNRRIEPEDPPTEQDRRYASRVKSQKVFAEELFYTIDKRRYVMTDDIYFASRLDRLHPLLKDIGRMLDNARRLLRTAYSIAERNIDTISVDDATTLHGQFFRCFRAISIRLEKKDVKICELGRS